ncbi:DUF2804 domain-containing protein [Cellulomonas composti]|uniref:Glycosyl hydrolase family 2 n=1 Tax=Cellulomonas composti TaxID=266130 RepID=A0A511JA05_9CELL|nr:DUF2804 domain-containing protein [Cellulomonas composti]GEL94821.1 hypothetical protein CCO02nite_14790 [Cellulomonas composti]
MPLPVPVDARELTRPVDLQLPDGRLNPDAVGWSRSPLHDTALVGRVPRRWGRAKRWEYWALLTPTHVVGLTVSSLDYLGLTQVWVLDRATGEDVDAVVVAPFARGTTLPGSLGDGPATASTRRVHVSFDETATGTRLRARTPRVRLDVEAALPPGRERLGVVVPWDERTFQYTVKDVGRPALGRLRVDDVDVEVGPGSWAVLDHGRGYWPRSLAWNWGFGAGKAGVGGVDGRDVALQLGGRWTDGTGSAENAVVVDGRLHKLRTELTWTWPPGRWTDPWHVTGDGVDLTFVPFHDRVALTDAWVVRSSTHQCFGHWSGSVMLDDGERLVLDGLLGSAEDVEQRW